jgi:hypothetical protein
MKRLLLGLLFALAAWAQPTTTTIADVLYASDGSRAQGTVYIRLNLSCEAPGGYTISALSAEPVSVVNGVFSKALVPNDTCVPASTSYNVQYDLTTSTGFPSPRANEVWSIPTSTPLTIPDVRQLVTPTPVALITTATALAADGSNCGAGLFPKGIDASGNSQGCVAVTLTTDITGLLPAANGGTGISTSASTGVPRITAGTWTIDAGITHLASSTSAHLAGVLSNETGSGLAVFDTSPTIVGVPVIGDGAGNDNMRFMPEASNPSCGAGEYRIWANSADGRWKKCQNGSITDLDTVAGVVTFDAVGAGTNVNALVIGNGGTLTATGTGSIVATTGDSATAFWAAGQCEAARGCTGDDTSASTGVPRITAGNWTYDAGISHLASSTSSHLLTVLSDETGSGLAVFATSPGLTTPTFTTSIAQAGGDPADAGAIRLNNAQSIAWEANPAGADVTFTVNSSNVMQASGTLDGATLTEGGNAVPSALDTLAFFAATSSAQLRGVLSDENGTGVALFDSSANPTLLDVTVDDLLTFAESAGDATCAAGDYWIKGNSSTNRLRGCENGTLFTMNVAAGAATWETLANSADTATSYLSNNTAETVTFSFESAFGASQQFLIRQQTGNPTAGTLLDVRAADAQVVVFRAGDGTNGITVSQAGALTAEGTGAITATLGDSATSFFGAGQIEAVRGGTGDDTSGTTGVPRIAAGNWTYDAGISHLAASSSADLAGVLSDETGSGGGFVRATEPTMTGPVVGNLSEATCDSSIRGKITVVQGGAGVADTMRACVKDSADSYAWRPIV